jgi:hypothetical protein
MAEIYERWVAGHAVIILSPTYRYQSPSPLIARLVSADGGNPNPQRPHGKRVAEAKRIEQQGWACPKHLACRAYGVASRIGVRCPAKRTRLRTTTSSPSTSCPTAKERTSS